MHGRKLIPCLIKSFNYLFILCVFLLLLIFINGCLGLLSKTCEVAYIIFCQSLVAKKPVAYEKEFKEFNILRHIVESIFKVLNI